MTDVPAVVESGDGSSRPSSKVRGDQMSGADQWAWAMRALMLAAGATGVDSYDADCEAWSAVVRLLEQLDEQGVREVAAHLALAPRRLRSSVYDLAALTQLTLFDLGRGLDRP